MLRSWNCKRRAIGCRVQAEVLLLAEVSMWWELNDSQRDYSTPIGDDYDGGDVERLKLK